MVDSSTRYSELLAKVTRFFWAIGFACLFAGFDPFGVDAAKANSLEILIARAKIIFSELFPNKGSLSPYQHMQDITVVLFTEEDLIHYRENWPPSYFVFARLLQTIAEYHPKAIYFGIPLAKRFYSGTEQELMYLVGVLNTLLPTRLKNAYPSP